jgi:hypothetical protein
MVTTASSGARPAKAFSICKFEEHVLQNGDALSETDSRLSGPLPDSGWRAAMCCANLGERGITQQRAARSAKRGVGHYWHCVLRTPGQQVMFNGAVTETVGNLICCAAIAMRNI